MSLRKYYAFTCIASEKVLNVRVYFHTTKKNHYPSINPHCHGKPIRKWARRADEHASTRQGPMANLTQTPFSFLRAWNIKIDIRNNPLKTHRENDIKCFFFSVQTVWIDHSSKIVLWVLKTNQIHGTLKVSSLTWEGFLDTKTEMKNIKWNYVKLFRDYFLISTFRDLIKLRKELYTFLLPL